MELTITSLTSTEEELLTRIKAQGTEVIESLLRINPKGIKEDRTVEDQTDSVTCSIQTYDNSVRKAGGKGEKPPPLTDSEASEDEDPNLASHLVRIRLQKLFIPCRVAHTDGG